MKYISLENTVQVVYQKNIIITLSFAINEPGIKTSRVFQKQNFQYTSKTSNQHLHAFMNLNLHGPF